MGKALLETGQMLTGKFGRRFMVKEQLWDKGNFQIYALSESGKNFWGVAIIGGSNRFKTEFLDKELEIKLTSKVFVWPNDIFNYSIGNTKGYGYVFPKPAGDGWVAFKKETDLDLKRRYLIAINLAKAFMKLHEAGYAYTEKPVFFYNDANEVFIVASPVKISSKFTYDDIRGASGFCAPEFFVRGTSKIANLETDKFVLASMVFVLLTGFEPFIEASQGSYKNNSDYIAYSKYIFAGKIEDYQDNFPKDSLEKWKKLSETVKGFFNKTFTLGVKDPNARINPEQWVYMLTKDLNLMNKNY